MKKWDYDAFTTALGKEYCEVIAPFTEFGADPQDGYEVFAKAYGTKEISPEKLHAAQISLAELNRLCDIARKWHESEKITSEHISEVLRRILWRWPPEAS